MIFFVEETDVCRVFRDSETWWTTTVGSAPICSQTVTRLTPYGFNSSRYEAKTLDRLFECALSEVSPLRVNQEVPTAPPAILLSATFVVLIFTDQKNAVRGETVGHGRSGDPHACPVLATVRHIPFLPFPRQPPHFAHSPQQVAPSPQQPSPTYSAKEAWHSTLSPTLHYRLSIRRPYGPLALPHC